MLKPAELERLLHELNAERHELRSKWLVPLVRLALETAMRQGELLSLYRPGLFGHGFGTQAACLNIRA